MATYSKYAYSKADIVVVDINLSVTKKLGNPFKYDFTYSAFKEAIEVIANNVCENTLVVIETTVPPGTTQKIIYPIFQKIFKKRKLNIHKLYLAYSYERVMPGRAYLNSIINFYRVYSGINEESKRKTKDFLEVFINTKDYPLFEMHSTTACEMAKVLENSFRATNIAFIKEWTDYAQRAEVDLFEVIEAIRMRPTHRNIMLPGFGVGGYCLPKDSLLADWSSAKFFDGKKHLEMSLNAIAINDLMPNHTFELLKQKVGNLKGKHITILGVSYLNDIADTRYSPTQYFYDKCLKEKAIISLHDSVVSYWQEKKIRINTDINSLKNKTHEVAIFAVRHSEYSAFTSRDILAILPGVKVVIDANNVINDSVAKELVWSGVSMIGVGKGHWKCLGRE
jgi:nucleotide sugar dehydrogenase